MYQPARIGIVLGIATLAAAVSGCATGGKPDVASDANSAMIDARAEAQLKRMGAFLGKQPALTTAADILYEDYLVEDKKFQGSRVVTLEFHRPNLLRATAKGDVESRRYWYDGKQVSILDETANVFARVDVPSTYDEMFSAMIQKYGMTMTLGELLMSDPAKELLSDVTNGEYIGIRTVGGYRCHQLAFSQADRDWQIWIDAGENPWPRKIVVTYSSLPAYPQFSATFTRWDTAASSQAGEYAFTPPAGSVEVDEIEPLSHIGSGHAK